MCGLDIARATDGRSDHEPQLYRWRAICLCDYGMGLLPDSGAQGDALRSSDAAPDLCCDLRVVWPVT
jgi:hypothetical protein